MLKSLYISFMFISYFSLKGNSCEKQISITKVSSKELFSLKTRDNVVGGWRCFAWGPMCTLNGIYEHYINVFLIIHCFSSFFVDLLHS